MNYTLKDLLNVGFELTKDAPLYKLQECLDQCLAVVDIYADKEYSPTQVSTGADWINLGHDKIIKNIEMDYSEIYYDGNEDKPFQMNIYFFGNVSNEQARFLGSVVLVMPAPNEWLMTKRERQEFITFLKEASRK